MARRLAMQELSEIVRRLCLGESKNRIHKETGTHRTIIRKIHAIASANGWLQSQQPLPSEQEISAAYYGTKVNIRHPLDAYKEELASYVEKKYQYTVIHQLIKERCGLSEKTIRMYIKRTFPQSPKVVMPRDAETGEAEVDFGELGMVYDDQHKRNRKAYIFSLRFRWSRRTYHEQIYDQTLPTFLTCLIHGFEYFGSVPRKLIMDNLKAVVLKAHIYDPVLNRLFAEFALYYGFVASPCKPYHPQHKGGVENDIRYVKRNFWPLFIESERQKGFETPRGHLINDALAAWDADVVDSHIVKGVGVSPKELFEEERKHLLSLPDARWEMFSWKKCLVHQEWRVQFGNAFYSVPYRFIGKDVVVCATSSQIRVFSEHEMIAVHPLATRKWQYVHQDEHAPPHQAEYMAMTKGRILAHARHLGPATYMLVERILNDRLLDGLRAARGIVFLAKRYAAERVNNACLRALTYETPTYSSVSRILEKRLDELPLENPITVEGDSALHANREYLYARKPGYFDTKITEEKENDEDNSTIEAAVEASEIIGSARQSGRAS